ncbi:MAG: peptidase T [Planctomycetales bacterium]|nr:peptidase T [Planctomycetales bacterium]
MQRERLLERFLKYVAVDTTAVESAATYPSSLGQRELGKMLVAELKAMGAADVRQDEHGLVWATVPASPGCEAAPVIAFNSHLDTSPETTGKDVCPHVIRNYAGGDIPLTMHHKVIRVADNPELEQLHGATLITTDGSTLLGADDKAGVAVIMEMAQRLLESRDGRERGHGTVRLLFTCDEEIGHGVNHVNLRQLGAVVGYTLDGAGADEIDTETFSADLVIITVRGVNIHPSIAKDRMVNAMRAAGDLLSRLPTDQAPETTSDREGFLHPYQIEGGVAEVKIRVLLRSFDTEELRKQEQLLRELAASVEQEHPGATIELQVIKQYRNMADGLQSEPQAVAYAEAAAHNLGRTPRRTIVRGGTDGSMLTERGLPTPNLSTGQHNPHSPLEWACLDEMEQAVQLIHELAFVWAEGPDKP